MSTEADINRKIEKAKHELEHMIDLNPSVMLLLDNSGTIMRANKALLTLLCIKDFTNILGQNINATFPCEDNSFFARLLDNRSSCDNMENSFLISGGRRLLRFTIIGSSSDTDLIALIVNDISSENEQACQREKQHKKEAVKALIGALLHNVNQPLTVIMLRAQLMHLELEKGRLNSESISEHLRDIMRLTTDIANLLRQVEQPTDYVTEPYSKGVDILDLKLSAGSSDFDMNVIGIPQALILALEVHDPGALAHATGTSRLALQIATQLGLDKAECETISRCALLHDIGKLGIPKHILQKPGPLSNEEYATILSHPEIGHNLLKNFHFLRHEAETCYAHAEWFNGAGYPRKLSGEDIPLYARITAVADAYSALIEKRPYQAVVDAKIAIREIASGSGTQFDPKVVEAFLSCPAIEH